MVEFGLKLEDNKVADWSEHYLNYDKLKSILTRCSASIKKFEELSLKRPSFAQTITEAYKAGLPTPHHSVVDLTALDVTATKSWDEKDERNLSVVAEAYVDEVDTSESAKLIEIPSRYGSTDTASPTSDGELDSSGNILKRVFVQATSGVSDFFQKSYERSLRDALKEIDVAANEFEQQLLENISRVNSFYNQKLGQLEGQVVHLKESVSQMRQAPIGPQPPEIDDEDITTTDNNETPIFRHRKSPSGSNPLEMAKAYFTSHIRKPRSTSESSQAGPSPIAPLLTGEDEGLDYVDESSAAKVREAESIQRALVDNYRTAKLLNNFALMNYTGFVKIVKKYDKIMPPDRKGRYKNDIKASKICNEGKVVEALATRMEKLYANWFCGRSISEARAQMLTKKGDGLEMDWSQLRLGYRMGMCTVFGLWVCWDCIWGLLREGNSTIGARAAFPVFRACGGLLMLQWCWGVSVWVWTRYRVNYIYLFDLNPNIVASPLVIFNDAVDNTLVYCVSTLLYYKAGAHAIPGSFPAGIFPFLMVVYTTYQLIFPIRTRGPMWTIIWQVITSPITSPTFFHGYVGDIFTSLVKVFQDLIWTAFFVLSGDWMISEDLKASTKHPWSRSRWYTNVLIPLVTLLPLWFRFNQCLRRYTDTGHRFPHLANAFKYALSQTVTLFGAFHPLYMRNRRESQVFQIFWMFAFIASSLYSFWWDLYMVSIRHVRPFIKCAVGATNAHVCCALTGLGSRASKV
jgi:EXS family/SPX domain